MYKARIGILDSFRTLAILTVILYHFFTRYLPPVHHIALYPYGHKYDYFGYGYLGVHFFFIISGFVIFYSLENTGTFGEFWKKRLIRLMPSLVIASVLTYVFCLLFDKGNIFPFSHSIWNFIPSLTFIKPEFFRNLSEYFTHLDYISSSYWSLWPEIQFYVYASAIYFADKKQFLRNFIIVTFGMIFIHSVFMNVLGSNKLHIDPKNVLITGYVLWVKEIFNLVVFLPLFAVGASFYGIFKYLKSNDHVPFYIYFFMGMIMLYHLNSVLYTDLRIIYIVMFGLFVCFIYFPAKLAFLENKYLTRIGACSYFLYLIHEHIGVLIIVAFSGYFMPHGFILTLILISCLIILSIIYTEKIESKLNSYIKRKFLRTEKGSYPFK